MSVYFATVCIVAALTLTAEFIQSEHAKRLSTGRATQAFPSKFLVLMAGLVLMFVSGFRWMIGADYLQYTRNYVIYRDEVLESIRAFDEPGIRVVAYVSSVFWDNPAMMFLFASVITVGLFTRTLAKGGGPVAFSFLLYIFGGTWHTSFNIVRQSIALAIVFAGHKYIVSRSFWRYLFVVLLATTFHFSAIAALFLYWVPTRGLKVRGMVALIAGVAIAGVASDVFLDDFISEIDGEGNEYLAREVNPIRTLIALAPVPLYFIVRASPTVLNTPYLWFLRNMALINAAAVVTLSSTAYLYRFAFYASMFLPLFLIALTNFKSDPLRHCLRFAIVVLYGSVWALEVSSSPDLNPFMWIWKQ